MDITFASNATKVTDALFGDNCGMVGDCAHFCYEFKDYFWQLLDKNYDGIIDSKEASKDTPLPNDISTE